MLSAGRQAAEVRVRVYLWLWAMLSTRDYTNLELRRTTGEWAALVGVLTDGAEHHQHKRAAAARRVSRAIDYLISQRLVARSGTDTLTLLDPDGSGDPYEPWTEEIRAGRAEGREDLFRFYGDRTDYRRSWVWEEDPLQIPATLWSNGTITALPAAAIVALLVLWDHEEAPGELIVVPKSRAYEYPLTHSTWHKGLHELETLGIIDREQGPLVFAATNANPLVTTDRHRVQWRINHHALVGA